MKKKYMNRGEKILISFCVTSALITVSYANKGGERKPPQEAINICEGQENGSECKMITPRGDTLTGTCQNTPDDKYFVCMPEGGPKGGGRPE